MRDTQKNFYKKLLGSKGERIAEKYLKKKGYSIIKRNYVTYYGEADIVAALDDVIVFVEVKTRTNEKFGRPCEAVDFRKQEKYRRIAEYFFFENKIDQIGIRFDVIEVLGDEINHIEDAFQ